MSLSEDLARLNEQQAQVIKNFTRSSLIVAGPGTGKTRTVSVLIGDLLQKGTRLKEILALTFSEKAALELRSRVLEYFPHSFDQCWISTFHSFCARILREQYHIAEVKPDFKLLTGFKEALLMSTICRRQSPESFEEFGKVLTRRGFQQEVLTFISLLKSNLVDPQQFAEAIDNSTTIDKRSKARLIEILALFKLYEAERNKTGYLDFRDLIALSIRVLQVPMVAQYYRRKFKVILVDEFQDTDPAQFLLLTLLKGDDKTMKTAVIGDPRQSIYRFRGADPSMMTSDGHFKKKYRAKVFPLEMNYRSARKIIDVATRLQWLEKSDDSSGLVPCSEAEGFVRFFTVRDELEEARSLSRAIASLLIYGRERKYKPSEIAILVRNNYQIDLIAECLQALHIPFAIAGDMKFFRSEEVIALASLLKAAAAESEAEENEALQRAFASPVFAISPLWVQGVIARLSPSFTMKQMLEMVQSQNFAELPDADEETVIKAGSFAETINILQNCSEQPLDVVFARLLLTVSHLLVDPSTSQARNILHFRGMIADYCELFKAQNHRQPMVSDLMPEFDEWLTYYASTLEQSQESSGDSIRIMTVHQSKGLEFPVVAICGLCEGLFPVNLRENLLISTACLENLKSGFDELDRPVKFFNPYPVTHEEHLEEERRLFFVALTRAKEGLLLTSPQRTGSDPAIPSPFLKEIGVEAETFEPDDRSLTLSEFRSRLALLSPGQLDEIEPVLQEVDAIIPKGISVHGVRPRDFSTSKFDNVHLPENFAFSASSLSNYIDCPRRFFFLNILRIQNPMVARQPYFVVGNAFHACLEMLHDPKQPWEQGKLPDDEDLEMIFTEKAAPLLATLDFFQRHLESSKIREAFYVYREAVFNQGQLPPRGTIGVEFPFSFTFHGCRFRGRFDRFVKNENGSVFVIDYKSSSSGAMSSDKVIQKAFPDAGRPAEMQMPLYLLACKEMGYSEAAAALLYIKQPAYKKSRGAMQPGFLRSASLNMGCGPEYGGEVSDQMFSGFEKQIMAILDEIKQDQTFDCKPSHAPDARSCVHLNKNRQPNCEFMPFCQERLDFLKQVKDNGQ